MVQENGPMTLDQGIDSLLGPAVQEDSAPEQQVEAEVSDAEIESEEVPVEVDEASEGDTAEEQEVDEGEEETEELYTVKVNGREEQVPLRVLVQRYALQQSLDEGFKDLRQQKETVTSEAQRAQAELQQTMEARQRYLHVLEETRARLGSLDEVQEPPEELRTTDPLRYQEMKIQAIEHRQRISELNEKRNQEMQAQYADGQRIRAEALKAEQDLLLQAIPEWQDPKVYATEASEVQQFAADKGYPPEVIMNFNHRDVQILRTAMKGEQMLESGKTIASHKVKTAAPTIKQGRRMKPKTKDATQKLHDKFLQAEKRRAAGDPHADPIMAAADFIAAGGARQR